MPVATSRPKLVQCLCNAYTASYNHKPALSQTSDQMQLTRWSNSESPLFLQRGQFLVTKYIHSRNVLHTTPRYAGLTVGLPFPHKHSTYCWLANSQSELLTISYRFAHTRISISGGEGKFHNNFITRAMRWRKGMHAILYEFLHSLWQRFAANCVQIVVHCILHQTSVGRLHDEVQEVNK
jgi:hypothetical protein